MDLSINRETKMISTDVAIMKKPTRTRFKRFSKDILLHTPFIKMVILLLVSWLVFSAGLYWLESSEKGTTIHSYGNALYWGIAAFSTAGIADTPKSSLAQLLGGLWIVIGSTLFFGTIVATVTTYFMRPLQRPGKRIIDTIEYNLEQLNELDLEELELLKETVDTLIIHVEKLKCRQVKSPKKT
jgi:voltage-gated potassium channel